jgi:hypothetical protein
MKVLHFNQEFVCHRIASRLLMTGRAFVGVARQRFAEMDCLV